MATMSRNYLRWSLLSESRNIPELLFFLLILSNFYSSRLLPHLSRMEFYGPEYSDLNFPFTISKPIKSAILKTGCFCV